MSTNNNNSNNKLQKPRFNFTWLYILLIAGLAFMIFTRHDTSASRSVDYTTFKEFVNKGYVADVTVNKDNNTLTLAIDSKHEKQVFGAVSKNKKPARIKVEFGSIDNLESYLDAQNKEGNFKGKVTYERDNDFFTNLLWNFAPLVIIILIWFFIMRGMGGGGFMGGAGNIFSVGKSKAQLFEKDDKNSPQITFKDVAGQAGAKQEVQEIVDFLKKPEKYTNLGGKIPKGALLVGPPGTGKTLLAKAVAGEAGVPFFSMSGSEFVEMFVGVGASRVRDLFQQAKAKAPCIIFIDEIDAIGRARSKTAAMGGNDERESTLNQLLTEMDGFGTNSGIIILAATNRADILDGALLRAGRFDRQIHVDLPDLNERKEIFMVHLKPLKIDETVEVAQLARQTPGFSGADIANVCNEAALIAARNNKEWVDKQCFLDAVDRIIGGETHHCPSRSRTRYHLMVPRICQPIGESHHRATWSSPWCCMVHARRTSNLDEGRDTRRHLCDTRWTCCRRTLHGTHLHRSHERLGESHQARLRHDCLCRYGRQTAQPLLLRQSGVPVQQAL